VRVLVTGAAGMLGHDLLAALAGEETLALTRHEADLADAEALARAVVPFRPEVVLHAAAWADVDGCERDPVRAERDNVTATRHVAALAAAASAWLLHVSTDYVFDGTSSRPYRPDDPTGPINVYGRSKLAAEEAVRASGARHAIVRTAWLVGTHGNNFVEAVRQRAGRGEELRVVSDQRGTPTFTFDLAPALVALARARPEGVLHLTNGGECTRFEQAGAILELEGVRAPLVPVTSEENPRPARRPKYSVLDNSAANAILGKPLPSWRDSLARYLRLRPRS
jgi:dTDP-4-dehydrorhamnose reductase